MGKRHDKYGRLKASKSPSRVKKIEAPSEPLSEGAAQEHEHKTLEATTAVDVIAQANLRLTRWLVIWTAILAIVAAITAGVGIVQWKALLQTDRTTREAFTAVQRPFIIATELAAVQDLPAYWSFQIILENTGSTPTKNMTVTSAVSFSVPILPDSPPDPEELKKQPDAAYPTITDHFIGPHGKVAIPAISLVVATLEEMANQRADFFVYGIARYNDDFNDTEERSTKFCFVVRPYKGQNGLRLQNRGPCHHWNCGDEDCRRDRRKYEEELSEALKSNPKAKELVKDIPIAAVIPFYPIPLVKAQ